jgi:hypothetical protein
MSTTGLPKLWPWSLVELREVCRRRPHRREVTVSGLHFLPEDSPHAVAIPPNESVSALPLRLRRLTAHSEALDSTVAQCIVATPDSIRFS